MDLLVQIKDLAIRLTYDMNPHISSFVVRMSFLLLSSYLMLLFSWSFLPFRSEAFQNIVFLMGIILAMNIPLNCLRFSAGFYTFLFLIAVICITYLPQQIPALLVPRYGTQTKLKYILYVAILVLFIIQLIVG
ncbi:hypothetical protein HZA73_09565 [candidate division TA06 bacterium]|nr:hypothetical protein [candidate division TA06 bacterium]